MFHPVEPIRWTETRLNRPWFKLPTEAEFWSLFEADGRAQGQPPHSLRHLTGGPVDLLIVVTTYRRAEPCKRLLGTLPQVLQLAQHSVSCHVLVLEDRSDQEYVEVRQEAMNLLEGGLSWLRANAHMGKRGFWKMVQTGFFAARILQPRHTLFIQDDVEFRPSMLREALELWRATESDALRRAIYLFSCDQDDWWGRWFRSKGRPAGEGLHLTPWLDLHAFIVDGAFFEMLGYRVIPIPPQRWVRLPNVSSGVASQLSRRLRWRAHVYQARPSLVCHGSLQSEMNPDARRHTALDNRKTFWSAAPQLLSGSRAPANLS